MVHGYSNDDLADKPTFKQVAKEVTQTYLAAVNVGHHNPVVIAVSNKEAAAYSIGQDLAGK